MGNLVMSSDSKDSRGVNVPDVSRKLRGLSIVRFAKPTPGFRQASLIFKSLRFRRSIIDSNYY